MALLLIFKTSHGFLEAENNIENLHLNEAEIKLEQGKQYLSAGLHESAIKIYEDLISDIVNESLKEPIFLTIFENASLDLAKAYLFKGNYSAAIQILSQPKLKKSVEKELIIAISYGHLGMINEKINILQSFLDESGISPLPSEIYLELGKAYFQSKKLQNAKQQLSRVFFDKEKPTLYYLSRLYQARIGLIEKNYELAEEILDSMDPSIAENNPFHHEMLYLKGELHFLKKNYEKAASFFENCLPSKGAENIEWYPDTLYYLGWCYLKIADASHQNKTYQLKHFNLAELLLKRLLEISPEEKVYLALGQCYLGRACYLSEKKALEESEKLLSKTDIFTTKEGKSQSLLLRAQAGPTYSLREKFFRQLTHETNNESSYYAKGWYLRGINEFEEAQTLLTKNKMEEAYKLFFHAAQYFRKAFTLLNEKEPVLAGLALKYQAQSLYQTNSKEGRLMAFTLLNEAQDQNRSLFQKISNPDELIYLTALIGVKIAQLDGEGNFYELADAKLKENIKNYPSGIFYDASLLLLGTLHFQKGNFLEAENHFLKLYATLPSSPLAGESLFWASLCKEELQQTSEEVRACRTKVFKEYPESRFADEAYFKTYSYLEYLQGERSAIKHLQNFKKHYPHSPLLINALYLIGMDNKRDRKSLEGKFIRRKNLTEAIDAFQEAESLFDQLFSEGLIPQEKLEYYISIRYRANLERAIANLMIAEESLGAKRQIYLEYAEEVFKKIIEDFQDPSHFLTRWIASNEPYPHIEEESSYWLSMTYIKGQNEEKSKNILSQMQEKYKALKITRGYFLSQVWYEQGLAAYRQFEYPYALQCFLNAEDASKGRVLSTDQKLNLWIQQSLCLKEMNQMDKAILILSKVINDDAVSGLRLKAMFLRSELYELDGRIELAKKQLESLSKKGGEWALKAKEKLVEKYGY